MVKKVFIEGMSCGHCASRIEKALGALNGVTKVTVNLPGKFAELESQQEPDEAQLQSAIDSAGYQLVKVG